MITIDDIKYVAKSLNFIPTEDEIKQILDEHRDACIDDPFSTWELIIENQMYNLNIKQTK